MNTATRPDTASPRRSGVPAQLSLFPAATSTRSADVPARFRLDEATRRRGLRHIARIRAQLEERYPSASVRGRARPPRRAA